MNRNFVTPGIILRSRTVGEKNRLLDILTPDRGILTGTAFGAASGKGKLRSSTMGFYAGEMFLYEDPVKGFIKVQDIDVQYEFTGIRKSTKRVYAASLMAEILIKLYWGIPDDPSAYRLFFDLLTLLNKHEEEDVLRAANVSLWRYLEILGEQPDLGTDCLGGDEIPKGSDRTYLGGEGGFTRSGGRHGIAGPELRGGEVAFLVNQGSKSLDELCKIELPEGADNRLFTLLTTIYQNSLQRPLKSLEGGFLP